MRKMRLTLLLTLLICISAQQPIPGQTHGTTAKAVPDHITLSWVANPATTMTVTWRTDVSVNDGFVEYRKKSAPSSKVSRVKALGREFVTDLGASKIFSSTLSKLSPGTEYVYRVGSGREWCAERSFRTAPKKIEKFKFLVFGDSQSPVTVQDPYGLWRDNLHAAFQSNPDAAFIVNVGDLVDFGQSEAHWNAWFEAGKGVIDTIPAMVLPGNHESYGMNRIGKPTFFVKQFTLPPDGPASLKNQVYSFDYGPVHLVALDSQALEQQNSSDILSIQKPWLEKDLKKSGAAWKVAFFHRAPYGVKLGRDETKIRDAFCPILERRGVNLVFNAHDHGIKRTEPLKDGMPVQDPLSGTTYYVTGRSGAKTYEDIEPMEHSAFFYAPLEQPNYLVVEGTKRSITVRVVLQDGTVLDTYTLKKR